MCIILVLATKWLIKKMIQYCIIRQKQSQKCSFIKMCIPYNSVVKVGFKRVWQKTLFGLCPCAVARSVFKASSGSDCLSPVFSRPDPDAFLQASDEDFSIPALAFAVFCGL